MSLKLLGRLTLRFLKRSHLLCRQSTHSCGTTTPNCTSFPRSEALSSNQFSLNFQMTRILMLIRRQMRCWVRRLSYRSRLRVFQTVIYCTATLLKECGVTFLIQVIGVFSHQGKFAPNWRSGVWTSGKAISFHFRTQADGSIPGT